MPTWEAGRVGEAAVGLRLLHLDSARAERRALPSGSWNEPDPDNQVELTNP